MALCLKCGSWKQAAASKCGCGFKPAKGTLDEAKSYALTTQFRSPEQLEDDRRTILAHGEVAFRDEELELARGIGRWNAVITLTFLSAATFTGLFIGTVVAGAALRYIIATGVIAFFDFVVAFDVMKRVDERVARIRLPF